MHELNNALDSGKSKDKGYQINLAKVLPHPLLFSSLSSALLSSCIINELFTIVHYKLWQLRKCWRFRTSSHPLPLTGSYTCRFGRVEHT